MEKEFLLSPLCGNAEATATYAISTWLMFSTVMVCVCVVRGCECVCVWGCVCVNV